MKARMEKLVVKILWFFAPFVTWFDHVFTIKSSVKKVTGDDYYIYRDKVVKGMVFVTDTAGQGSNIINPSKGKHGAIYYGRGLATHTKKVLERLDRQINDLKYNPGNSKERADKLAEVQNKFDRIHKVFNECKLDDEICYVIESLGKGVYPKNLVRFMTEKDVLKGFIPKFVSDEERSIIMSNAADFSVEDFGLPYDYGFSNDDQAKYCFEVPADAYVSAYPGLRLRQETLLGHSFYLANTFTEAEDQWELIINLPVSK